MKLIHASGFNDAERESFRIIVYNNVMTAMQIIFEVMEQLEIPFENKKNQVMTTYAHKSFLFIYFIIGIWWTISRY